MLGFTASKSVVLKTLLSGPLIRYSLDSNSHGATTEAVVPCHRLREIKSFATCLGISLKSVYGNPASLERVNIFTPPLYFECVPNSSGENSYFLNQVIGSPSKSTGILTKCVSPFDPYIAALDVPGETHIYPSPGCPL